MCLGCLLHAPHTATTASCPYMPGLYDGITLDAATLPNLRALLAAGRFAKFQKGLPAGIKYVNPTAPPHLDSPPAWSTFIGVRVAVLASKGRKKARSAFADVVLAVNGGIKLFLDRHGIEPATTDDRHIKALYISASLDKQLSVVGEGTVSLCLAISNVAVLSLIAAVHAGDLNAPAVRFQKHNLPGIRCSLFFTPLLNATFTPVVLLSALALPIAGSLTLGPVGTGSQTAAITEAALPAASTSLNGNGFVIQSSPTSQAAAPRTPTPRTAATGSPTPHSPESRSPLPSTPASAPASTLVGKPTPPAPIASDAPQAFPNSLTSPSSPTLHIDRLYSPANRTANPAATHRLPPIADPVSTSSNSHTLPTSPSAPVSPTIPILPTSPTLPTSSTPHTSPTTRITGPTSSKRRRADSPLLIRAAKPRRTAAVPASRPPLAPLPVNTKGTTVPDGKTTKPGLKGRSSHGV